MAQTRSIEEILTLMAKEIPGQNASSGLTPGRRAILNAYESLPYWSEAESGITHDTLSHLNPEPVYKTCMDKTHDIEYEIFDIMSFVNNKTEKKLSGSDDTLNPAAGIFISALINSLTGKKDIVLSPSAPINFLGYRLGETAPHEVTIYGDTGMHTGMQMKDGQINVRGDAGSVGDNMTGGVIHVLKHAGKVGERMQGGYISICGDVKGFAASENNGGVIHIKGNAFHVGYKMSDGYVTVDGHTGDMAGWDMQDGQLNLNGTVGEYAAWRMKGGKIVVLDVADRGAGEEMTGGEIYLLGGYKEAIGKADGGKIYFRSGERNV